MIAKQFALLLSLVSALSTSAVQASADTAQERSIQVSGDTAQEGSISLQDLRCYFSHLSPEIPITFQQITDFSSADWGRVAAALHGNKAQQLFFCGSHIGDEGATNIAAMVLNMPCLTHLSLQGTGISTAGLVEICDALNNRAHNEKYSLQYLDVRGNNLCTLASIKSLVSLSNRNPNFMIVKEFCDKDTLSDIIKKMRLQNKSTTEVPGTTSCISPRRESVVDTNNCSATPRIGDRRGGLRGLFGLGNSQQSLGCDNKQ